MSQPTVDIGISVFRRGEYIAQLLECVLAQTYPHWRATIVEDDGPTDVIRRAVDPYLADERIEYVAQHEHLGPSGTKARAIDRGEGSYIAVPDDDDLISAEWLERRLDFMERHPDCVLVGGGHIDVDQDGAELRRSPFPFPGGVVPSREFVAALMRRNCVAPMSVLVRRDCYVRAGDRVEQQLISSWDWELWLRLGMFGPVGFLPVHDSCYRIHPAQISRLHNRGADHLLLFEQLDALLEQHHPDLRLSAREYRRGRARWLLSVALDAAEAGDRRRAAERVATAARLAPRALASARGVAAIAAAAGGARVSRHLSALRS